MKRPNVILEGMANDDSLRIRLPAKLKHQIEQHVKQLQKTNPDLDVSKWARNAFRTAMDNQGGPKWSAPEE